MKMRLLIFTLLFFPLFLLAQNQFQTLFLGNSYTYVNDLPALLRSLTLAAGDTLLTDVNAPGGYTLQGHSTNATSLNLIRARQWDFVVLQEQSQIPSFPQSQVQNMCYPYAAILNDSIKSNDSCTVTVFYMTWGRKYGDAGNCSNWPPVCTYEGMQAELRQSYLNLANQNSALVAPVGVAWWEAMKRDTLIELYNPDESHPAYTGSYLAACVFYGTMYRRSPLGLNWYGSLDSTTATFLQTVAHDVVFDSIPQWRIGLDDAQASFGWTVSMTMSGIDFSNTSGNASSYIWDFGDGSSDSTASPSHEYPTGGGFVVTLIASNGCTSDTFVDSVYVPIVAVDDPQKASLELFPNPSRGKVRLSGKLPDADVATLQILDLSGRLVFERKEALRDGKLEQELDLSDLPKGSYLLRLNGENFNIHQRLVLQ